MVHTFDCTFDIFISRYVAFDHCQQSPNKFVPNRTKRELKSLHTKELHTHEITGMSSEKKIGVHVFGIPPLLAKLSRTILIWSSNGSWKIHKGRKVSWESSFTMVWSKPSSHLLPLAIDFQLESFYLDCGSNISKK